MSGSTSEQERIEQDLDRTRTRMDERLSALQERFTPGQIIDDLMSYFRGSEGADFARNLLASVQSNPMPAALTGIGLTWLMASNPRPQQQSQHVTVVGRSGRVPAAAPSTDWAHDDLEARYRSAEQGVTRGAEETEEAHNSRLDEARGQALGIARQAQETAQSYAKRIQDAFAAATQEAARRVGSLRDRAGESANQLGGAIQNAGDNLTQGGQAAQNMASSLISSIGNNPVLLGSIGLAVGALLGTLVPQSEQEEAALGGMAKQARETVRDLGQQAMDRGGQVAQDVMDATRDSARAHGLTSDKSVGDVVDQIKTGGLSGAVKDVARDALKAGDEALHKQGADKDRAGEAEAGASSPQASSQPGPGGASSPRPS